MKFICRKFKFDPLHYTSSRDINFFNPNSNVTQEAEVDLTPYIILGSVGDNSYKSPNVDSQNNNYYFEANGVQFEVSGARDNNYLLEFFETLTKTINYKWILIQEDDNNTPVFYSIISKDKITVDSLENKVMTIRSYSYEVEFKSWWTTRPLPTLTTWDYRPFRLPNGVPLARFEARNVVDVFRDIFSTDFLTDIRVDNNIAGWYVSRTPYFYLPMDSFLNSQMDMFSGYDVFVHQQLSCFEYLNSMCKAMGWKWFFYQGILYIKNLYTAQGDIVDIDYEKLGENGVIESGIENTFLDLKIENVVVKNGSIDGGQAPSRDNESTAYIIWGNRTDPHYVSLIGDRHVIFSKNFYLNHKPTRAKYTYQRTVTGSSSGYMYKGELGRDYETFRYKGDEQSVYQYDYIQEKGLLNEPRSTMYVLPKDTTLVIDVACNTDQVTRIDMNNVREISNNLSIYNGQYQIDAGSAFGSVSDLQFNGNPASALFKFNTDLNKFVTYEWYTSESQEFKDNFSTYLGDDLLQLVRIKGDGIQYSPLNRYRIVNYPPELLHFNDKVFNMHELNYNLQDRTFELKIITSK